MISIIILSLRLITAAVRFLLIVYIEKEYSVSVLGEFSIYSSLITIGSVLIGMELHYVLSRSISKASYAARADLISSEFSLFFRLYLILLIISFVISAYDLNNITFSLILILIITEHISLECLRAVQAAFMPIFSTIIIFSRSVGWYLILLIIDHYADTAKSINHIIVIWTINSFIVSLVVVWFLKKYGLLIFKRVKKLHKNFIKVLLYRSRPFYLTALIFSVSQYTDRFLLGIFYASEEVGKYFFVASLASVLNLFVTYAVSVIWGPRVVKYFKILNKEEFRVIMKKLRFRYAKWMIFGFVCALISYFPFIKIINLETYNELYFVYVILLFGNLIQITSDYFNMYLYAGQRDWIMFRIVVKNALLNLLFMSILVPFYGVMGAAIGFLISQTTFCMFRVKAVYNEELL